MPKIVIDLRIMALEEFHDTLHMRELLALLVLTLLQFDLAVDLQEKPIVVEDALEIYEFVYS